MTCETLQQGRLVDYLAGMLDEAARQDVERHLAACPRCRADADAMGATLDVLRTGLATRRDEPLRLDAGHRRGILQGVRGQRGEVIRSAVWWVRWQPLVNIAALLVLVLTGVTLFMPALSMSRGRAKQSVISASRAREAQHQLAMELAEVNGVEVGGTTPERLAAPSSAPMDAIRDRERPDEDGDPASGIFAAPRTRTVGRRIGALRAYGGGAVAPGTAADLPAAGAVIVAGNKEELTGKLDDADKKTMADETVNGALSDRRRAEDRDGRDWVDAAVPAASLPPPADAPRRPLKSLHDLRDNLKQQQPRQDESKAESKPATVEKAKSPLIIKGTARLSARQEASTKYKAVAAAGGDRSDIIEKTITAAESPAFNAALEPARPAEMAAEAGEGRGEGSLSSLERIVPAQKEATDEMPIEEPAPVYGQTIETAANPFSTFAIDVDTASFTRSRQLLLNGKLPPPGAVRVEEFVNAFEYDYPPPERRAFAVYTDRVRSPFRPPLELLRIGVRGKVIGRDRQKRSVLTVVIDASGSMNTPDRLDLVKASLRLLLDSMAPADRLSIVTFGSETRLVLDDAPVSGKDAILKALDGIQTSGSTQLEGGVRLGYETAARHFRSGSVNRVLILSDGVANLGAATAAEILGQVERYRRQGIYCSVFGFGRGVYNDAMLETLADKGDGVYRFVDSLAEARRVFVDDLAANLHVIARDVKIQVEFDPRRVQTYRQLGYENRALTREQFRDDTVDAGEVGSGQSVTALYELKVHGNAADPLGTVRVRWMDPETGRVEEMEHAIRASGRYDSVDAAPARFRLAAAVAELADHLRRHPLASGTDVGEVERVIRAVALDLHLDQRVADLVRMVTLVRNLEQ